MSCKFNRYFNRSPWDYSKFCMISMCAFQYIVQRSMSLFLDKHYTFFLLSSELFDQGFRLQCGFKNQQFKSHNYGCERTVF